MPRTEFDHFVWQSSYNSKHGSNDDDYIFVLIETRKNNGYSNSCDGSIKIVTTRQVILVLSVKPEFSISVIR